MDAVTTTNITTTIIHARHVTRTMPKAKRGFAPAIVLPYNFMYFMLNSSSDQAFTQHNIAGGEVRESLT